MTADESTPRRDGARAIDLESTAHLIKLARAGNEEALNRLFALHRAPLRRWTAGRLPRWARDMADTEDLVQEALLSTLKRIGEFEARHVGSLQAYLRQAILNRIRDELRRAGRQPLSLTLDTQSADDSASPLEEAIGREAVERYERALASLRDEDREAIIARVELGYSHEELAMALDKPSAEAARKAAQRALVRLATEMERAEKEPAPGQDIDAGQDDGTRTPSRRE
jgi:RNA polymerase sigma-70 factor (ECF subfamily)